MSTIQNRLSVVPNETPDPPYPADTRAKGFAFDIDVERLYQSKTWLLAAPEIKGWLLRLWVESWRSIPVGSFEDDDEMIAARIQMPEPLFQAHRKQLMRGWVRHSDGNLYHSVITEMVLKIECWREKERSRKRDFREKMSRGTDVGQTWDRRGTPPESAGIQRKDDTTSSSSSSSTSTEENTHPTDESPKTSGEVSGPAGSRSKADAKKPPCPYREILALWRDTLPELPQPHDVEHWTDARKAQIRARWHDQLPDLDAWAEMFALIRASPFLLGRAHSPGRKPFRCDLFWITKPENMLRLYEGKYSG